MFNVDLRDCLCSKTFLFGGQGVLELPIDRVTVKFFCFEMELSISTVLSKVKVTLRFKYVLVPFIHQRNSGNNTMAAAGFISLKF